MCSQEEKIQLIRDGKSYTFRKTSFWISTGLTLVILLVGFIMAFTTVRLQAETNRKDVIQLQSDVKVIDRIDLNLKNLCIQMDVEYIE